MTNEDIKQRLRLYLSEKQIGYLQDYQVIGSILDMAFGEKGASSTPSAGKAPIPQTAAEARVLIAGISL